MGGEGSEVCVAGESCEDGEDEIDEVDHYGGSTCPDGLESAERGGEGIGNKADGSNDGRRDETLTQVGRHFEEDGGKDWERDREEPLWHTVAAVAGYKTKSFQFII